MGLIPFSANANVYKLEFSTFDSVFSVSALVTTANVLDAPGGYDVLSISGTISGPGGGSIALVANPSPPSAFNNGTWIYDNVYFPGGSPLVDNPGLFFVAGGYDYNLYSTGPATYYLSSDNPAGAYNPGELVSSISDPAVPEVSTWAMMLVGFGGLGLLAAQKSRNSAPAPAGRAVG
jgi:hypothetical protein